MSPYETFEHTADVGLRVRSADLPGLFAEAARGFFSLVIDELDSVRPAREIAVELAADGLEDLMLDWLGELLYRFDGEQLVLCEFDVDVSDCRLQARCRGEPIDWDRHRLSHEIKAVTYHHLRVERQNDDWLAEVIFDI